jgi:hypothetical protein
MRDGVYDGIERDGHYRIFLRETVCNLPASVRLVYAKTERDGKWSILSSSQLEHSRDRFSFNVTFAQRDTEGIPVGKQNPN